MVRPGVGRTTLAERDLDERYPDAATDITDGGAVGSVESAVGLTTPVGRSGTADEVAAAVAWLASPGGAYTTGQCVVVDGGNSIAEERR